MSLSKMKRDPSLQGSTTISDMPPNIIENILSRLPIKEAVRTCILSKEWRFNWVTLPELIFDCFLIHTFINQNLNLVRFIDEVLSHHRGPICKFEISHLWFPYTTDIIDKWILCLSRNYIQKLILRLQPWPINYELPSCIYSCEHLIHLELSFCTLRRPPLFANFESLRSLVLYKVDFVGFTFENLISRCPQLEKLKIEGFTDSTDLLIYAPKLQELVVVGFCKVMQNIHFKNTPQLASVSLHLLCFGLRGVLMNQNHEGISRLMKVFGSLVGIEKLSVGGNFLKFLAVDLIPMRLPNAFYHLKRLDLEICFKDLHMMSAGLCLIRSAPNLEELKIDAVPHTYTTSGFWEVPDGLECSLNHLQNVIITRFDGLRLQLEFIKLLLTITPALEKMSIHGFKHIDAQGQPMNGSRMLEELMHLRRASMNAQFEYFEANELVGF
ncbi:F-box/FBD/LRR-repeat protein At1g13570-like [Telopea speciosissima]|uniref:F-box/FBD/LRR-repeat protein At1g13570-like n=1 Tax=Telopea speciosissima TaxID=54955 RepID=UPI001CC65CFD|nr:F-box/FBD/LRR-repeat protein At1g13570-like [Telopea speciosissima]